MINGEFNAFPLSVGSLYGRRSFDIGNDGQLLAVFADYEWKDGENVAECKYRITHPEFADMWRASDMPFENTVIPSPNCMCGFWSYHNNHNIDQYSSRQHGIVEVYGRTIVGTLGFRSEKARIVALVLPDVVKNRRLARRTWHPVHWLTRHIQSHGNAAGIQWLISMIGLSVWVSTATGSVLFWLGMTWWLYFSVGAAISIVRDWMSIGRASYSTGYTAELQHKIAEHYPGAEIFKSERQMYAAYADRMDILKDAPDFKERMRKTNDTRR